jgi:Transglycosylase-like domain
MKRFMLPVGTAIFAVVPGVAAAKPTTPAHAKAYERAYHQVSHELGRRAPGRNLLKGGLKAHRSVTDANTLASLFVLERMLAPASSPVSPVSPVSGSSAATSSSLVGGSTAGAGTVPACASESGTNYSTGSSNTNASSGATGRYQILPSTAAAYGCNMATAAGQDACAQTIYQHQGASAWVGCGG